MKVGSLVECQRDLIPVGEQIIAGCKPCYKGFRGHVREMDEDDFVTVIILLEEIINPFHHKGKEWGYDARDFRELLPPIPNVEDWVKENTGELVSQ